MLFVKEEINNQDLNSLNNFFQTMDNEFKPVETVEEEIETPVSKYISSLVLGQYQKSVDAIENTVIGNTRRRKRNLQQIMKESFFAGANRFGNNFIA